MSTLVNPNVSDTESYRFVDRVASWTVRSLSRTVGVKNVTRPFWNRWRASSISDETLMRFLNSIDSIDDWPHAATVLLDEAADQVEKDADQSAQKRIDGLRHLSYLAHMTQWGCLPINDVKRTAYRRSRDYYLAAESLAWGELYHRVEIPWAGRKCYGNLHLPRNGGVPAPLIIIIHGMDDTKEEHLATELTLQDNGFAVFCLDGPGQGESFFLEGLTWSMDFTKSVQAAMDAVSEQYPVDASRIGVIGISWGGLWAIKLAAEDPRVGAVYDLGGPVDTAGFRKLPFFLKSKYCQVLGVTGPNDLPEADAVFSLRNEALLDNVRVPLRIVHGRKDPLVTIRDKEWLRDSLQTRHKDQEVTLKIYDDGDHCCTGHAVEIRRDTAEFFHRALDASPAR